MLPAMIAADVVLPCLNEQDALLGVLRRLPAGFRPIVVDNGSTDDTARVAAAAGALVVTEPRRGYGAAVHAGLLAASAEYVCVLDADGSMPPEVLPAMLEAVAAVSIGARSADAPLGADARSADAPLGADARSADAPLGVQLAVGRRRPVRAGVWPWHARAGNVLIAALLRRRGVPVHDIAPVRVARRSDLLALGIEDRGSGYPLELLLRAGAAGWRLREFDVPYSPRAGGVSKVSGSLRGTVKAAANMTSVLGRVSSRA
jgi:glycosyltransferase involved in cell wall biosynthesis